MNQYVEVFPTPCGHQPTNKIPPGGSGGGSGSGGGISASTASQLAKLGPAGQAAAGFALATAPARAVHKHGKAGGGSAVSAASAGGGGASPITSLVKALTGSSSGGGLGTFLPILLIAAVIGLAGIALLRRRRGAT